MNNSWPGAHHIDDGCSNFRKIDENGQIWICSGTNDFKESAPTRHWLSRLVRLHVNVSDDGTIDNFKVVPVIFGSYVWIESISKKRVIPYLYTTKNMTFVG